MAPPRTSRRQETLEALATSLDGQQKRELFRQYRIQVYTACLYSLKERADAEDACHEVFVRLFRRLAKKPYGPSTPVQALLKVIIHHRIVDAIRRRKNLSEKLARDSETANLVLDPNARAETLVELSERSQVLQRLKDELTPTQREVLEIWLLHGDDRTTAELAGFLGIKDSTFRSHQRGILEKAENLHRVARKRTGSEK